MQARERSVSDRQDKHHHADNVSLEPGSADARAIAIGLRPNKDSKQVTDDADSHLCKMHWVAPRTAPDDK